MATTVSTAISILTNHNQTEEDLLAIDLVGVSEGSSIIYNTTLAVARIWNGTAFQNTPLPIQYTNLQVIRQSSDFPAPDIDGFTNTPDFTTYQISGAVTGDFKFKCGMKTSFVGLDRVNDKLTSTTTGVMFTMDGTTTSKANILFSDVTIGCPNGTLFNVVSTTANQAVGMISVTISTTKHLGTMNNISTWAMTNIVMRNGATNSGFIITGNNGTIKCRLAVFGNNVGTTFDFTGSTQEIIDFNNNQISSSSGQTFISAIPTNVTVWGKLNDNTFTGAGTFITGVVATDILWNFADNLGVTNTTTPSAIPILLTAPISPTLGQQWILQAGTVAGGYKGFGAFTDATSVGTNDFKLQVHTSFGTKETQLN